MNFYASHYRSGESIFPGDTISVAGDLGRVIFVLNPSDKGISALPIESRREIEWLQQKYVEGFMIETKKFGRIFSPESDEDILFVSRGDPVEP